MDTIWVHVNAESVVIALVALAAVFPLLWLILEAEIEV